MRAPVDQVEYRSNRKTLFRLLASVLFLAVAFLFGPTLASTQVVINEIDYDQSGTDAAEFVEIKNVGAGSVDLSSFQLEFINGSTTAVYDTIALSGTLPAGDYFVVCANAATVANCDLDDSPDTNFIQNGAPDAVAITSGGAIVDTVSYEGDTGAPYTEGSGSGSGGRRTTSNLPLTY